MSQVEKVLGHRVVGRLPIDQFGDADEPPILYIILDNGAMVADEATIGEDVEIGPGVRIEAQTTIGSGVVLGPFVTVSDNVNIGAGTKVGSHTAISHEVTIGENAVIGSHCYIADVNEIPDGADVPDYTLVASQALDRFVPDSQHALREIALIRDGNTPKAVFAVLVAKGHHVRTVHSSN